MISDDDNETEFSEMAITPTTTIAADDEDDDENIKKEKEKFTK